MEVDCILLKTPESLEQITDRKRVVKGPSVEFFVGNFLSFWFIDRCVSALILDISIFNYMSMYCYVSMFVSIVRYCIGVKPLRSKTQESLYNMSFVNTITCALHMGAALCLGGGSCPK